MELKTDNVGKCEGWVSAPLGSGISLLSGHHILARYCNTDGYGTPYLTGPADFPDGRIEHSKYTERPSTLCRKGDILVTVKGSGSGSIILSDGKYCISRQLMAIRPIEWIGEFLYYVLLQNGGVIAAASTGLIPGLSRSDITEQLVSIPSVLEQRAIAAALSDADALIASLEALIAKKRDLKQAAMQQLLTGKTRLPGFTGEWKAQHLSDVSWFQEGPGVRNYQFTNSGVKLLNGTNISKGVLYLETTERFISEAQAFGPYSHFLADEGDIVIASSGVTIDKFHEKICIVSLANLPLCMNTSTIRFKPNRKLLVDQFLISFLESSAFKAQIGGVATGSAQLNFGPSHLSKIEIFLPSVLEQIAIAAILNDMQVDLTALESKRDKAIAIKQGMMQELLTGRIRLV